MKKLFSFALCVILLVATACTPPETPAQNSMAPKNYTGEAGEIKDVLKTGGINLYVLEYQTEDLYETMEVWLEVYENGQMINKAQGLYMSTEQEETWSGEVVLIIQNNPNEQFTFVVRETDTGTSATYTLAAEGFTGLDRSVYVGWSQAIMAQATEIKENEEIILYIEAFSETGELASYDTQMIQEQPSLIEEYDGAYVIKCKFSK